MVERGELERDCMCVCQKFQIQYDTEWYRMIQYDTEWYSIVHDTEWIQYGTVWYGLIQYDT